MYKIQNTAIIFIINFGMRKGLYGTFSTFLQMKVNITIDE